MNIQQSAIELLAGPARSKDLIDELRLKLVRIIDERPPDPVAQLARVSPELAKDIARATPFWGLES